MLLIMGLELSCRVDELGLSVLKGVEYQATSETTLHVCLIVVVLYGAVLSLTAKTSVWYLLVNKHQCNSKLRFNHTRPF